MKKTRCKDTGHLDFSQITTVTNTITIVTILYKLTQIKAKIRQIHRFQGFYREFRTIRLQSLPGAWRSVSAENPEYL